MPSVSELEAAYTEAHPTSQRLHDRATACFPNGVTHDARYFRPFPVYATEAAGGTKWDVDGNAYVDYAMGHGALLFGYGDDRVRDAFRDQLDRAVHMGTSTELEIEWAELIKELVPCAADGLVRAHSSGSEAMEMAIRLARIHTGKEKIVIQAGAYHGKGDQVIVGRNGPPFGQRNVRGIPEAVRDAVEIVPLNDLEAVEAVLAEGDVACLIHHSNNLYEAGYLEGLRELTRTYGVVFIMDEVVSGFRYAAGGAQEYYDVEPDLAVIGKIIGGGAPVGAVVGRSDILEYYSIREEPFWDQNVRIAVGGTWNAQPLSIVGGIAAMRTILEDRDGIYRRLSDIGNRLTTAFIDHADDLGVTATAYGLPPDDPAQVKLVLLDRPVAAEDDHLFRTGPRSLEEYERRADYLATDAAYPFSLSMIQEGVYAMHGGRSLTTCTAYTEEDLQTTEAAFRASLSVLAENGLIGTT